MNLGIKFITGVTGFYLHVASTNFHWWTLTRPVCITEGSLELKASVAMTIGYLYDSVAEFGKK